MPRRWLKLCAVLLPAALWLQAWAQAAEPQSTPVQSSATAASTPASQASSGEEVPFSPQGGQPSEEFDQMLDATRRSVRSTVVWLARGVDSWFGKKPFEAGGKVTDGRLDVGLLKRHGESEALNMRFDARFRLPNIEEHAYLFLGSDNEREAVTDKPDALSGQEQLRSQGTAGRAFFAGLVVPLLDSVDFRIGVRGALKPFMQVRYLRSWQLDPADLVEFRETVFWTLDDYLGSTTAVSYEHAFSSTLAGRCLSSITKSQRYEEFDWSTNLGMYSRWATNDCSRWRLSCLVCAFPTERPPTMACR